MKIVRPFLIMIQKLRLLYAKAMEADIYIVGVCLGAQLLSVAYGGKYEHSPEREIGVFPITAY